MAIHLGVLLVTFLVRSTVEPLLPGYTATQLYLPAAGPVATAVRRPALRLVAPPPFALLAALPAPKHMPEIPALPELSVGRAVPVHERLPMLLIAAAMPPAPPPAPPSPVFASAIPAAPPTRHVPVPQTGLFAAVPVTPAPAAAKLQVVGGAFGTVPADPPRRIAPTAAGFPAGFGAAGVNALTPPRGPAVAPPAGFGGVAAAGTPEAPPPPTAPVATAFVAAVAADPVRHASAPRPAAAEPLEILFKPRPAYTEEARGARIEGDIVLEVLFTRSGTLRVLRVVRGLGHGLDQNALDAAAKIRFRPAAENGRTVDTVATIRISFQLAY